MPTRGSPLPNLHTCKPSRYDEAPGFRFTFVEQANYINANPTCPISARWMLDRADEDHVRCPVLAVCTAPFIPP